MIKKNVISIFKYFCVFSVLLLFLMPFYLMIINSFKTTQQFVTSPFSLPKTINFNNFIDAFIKMNFLKGLFNTFLITIVSVFFIIITSSMASYFLVRFKWKINSIIFGILVASMIIPFQAIMIPIVSLYGKLELLNNRWILIFMYIGFGQAFAVFIFHGFIKNIPTEIEEAGLIDGCNRIKLFFNIVFPLLKPVLMTVLILDILWIWNDFLLPSLILLSPEQRTLPLSTYSFFTSYSVDYSPLMAGIVLTILPILIIYLVFQKYIIEGVISGAVK